MNTPNLPILPATKMAVGEVAVPVITGTLTTMAPFAPLLFWPGIMGEFMSYIPATIILTLLASMFVAFVMNPVFAVSFMKYREGKEGAKLPGYKIFIAISVVLAVAVIFYATGTYLIANLLTFGVILFLFTKYIISPLIKKFQKNILPVFSNAYSNTLEFLLKGKRPYLVLASTIFLFVFTIFLLGIRTPKIVLFPQGDPSNIYVYLRMPSGTDIDVTDSVTKVLEVKAFEVLGGKDNPDVESVISNVAIGAGQNFFERSTQSKLGKITISFVEYKYRVGQPTGLYVNQLRDKLVGIPGAEIVVDVDQMGPPTGKPISIEISGAGIAELVDLTEKIRLFIENLQIAGIEELKSDMEVNNPELYIEIDREKANKLGLNTAMIGMTMRTALFGKDISKFREGEDEFDIRIRLKEEYRKDLSTLMNMIITAPGGNGPNGGPKEIPLSAVATANFTTSYGGIIRKDNNRMITISSNILDGYNANEIVGQLRKEMSGFQIPEGYSVKFAGEQDDQNEAADFLVWALFAAVGLIFIILVTQFNSISKPIIILVQVLFSIIGVLLGLVIFNLDISVIMTGMGIIAVAGIVVKNAIILFDYADLLMEKGTPMRNALIEAGRTRLIPVILTAVSTILGLLPLAIGMNIDFAGLFTEFDPQIYFGGTNATFWKPLAWSIIFGLSFATILTLVVVPSMYLMVSRAKTGMVNVANKIAGNGN
jgi:multidrug efflux pump subunit AcrB